jgi:hypothetical protein
MGWKTRQLCAGWMFDGNIWTREGAVSPVGNEVERIGAGGAGADTFAPDGLGCC